MVLRSFYKSNGSIAYVDSFGEAGTNGSYELLDNDTKIKIGFAGMYSIVGENLTVTSSQFAYTLKVDGGDSTRFVFSPFH